MGSRCVRAIGLMSGTSLDAVDAALLETDGDTIVRPLAFAERPYSDDERALLQQATAQALAMAAIGPDPLIRKAEAMLTRAHAEAIARLAGAETAEIIGFHGQTLAHRPPSSGHPHPFTWQMGDAALLARLTGKPVVHDFRSADVAAGGEGAPLAPGYHRAMLQAAGVSGPAAVLNIGGVANISWFAGFAAGDAWGACDTGPGNGPLDDWVAAHGLGRCDFGGALAAGGAVDEARISSALARTPADGGPRSLDRADWGMALAEGLSAADGAATLTALTAATVAAALAHLPVRPARLLLTGGGRLNPVMAQMIAQRCGVAVVPVETHGFNGNAIEAEAFAWLAVRHLQGLPISWPQSTGAPRPLTGGKLANP